MIEIEGIKLHLTRHGRKRYDQRVGTYKEDKEILEHCIHGLGDFEPVWASHRSREGFVLVSVIPRIRPRKAYF